MSGRCPRKRSLNGTLRKCCQKRQKARSGVSYSHLNKHCLINLLEGFIDETGLWHRNTRPGLPPKISPKLPESDIIVVGRNVERGEQTVADIRAAGGEADFLASDLRDASSARAVARRAVALGNGQVDILINNAGIYPFGPTHDMTEDLFERVYALNVKVPYFLVATLAPLMAQRGKGVIVNLSTMAADYGAPGMSLYGSSKAAINLLTKTWAAEYGPSGVRVNAVSPGPTRTEGTDAMGEGLEQLAAQAPAGRPATADEIAEAIVFLATDRASFIHGAKLAVDGGRTAV
jgi:NAD(P)-dependent dehydrogenase (short-subunit alcohol dehydrogenase family)